VKKSCIKCGLRFECPTSETCWCPSIQRGKVSDWRTQTVSARRVCRWRSIFRVCSRECGDFPHN
jgi:hypothetical protein